jgi:glycosyltransferase involved in cell wall biosynthesis
MSTLPKITIVTPSFNQASFIKETIESVINQDYPNFEYFVADGGSTDGSVDIIREYEDKITWWISEKDDGQSDAINKGFRRSTGELCAWVNSDDVLLPNCLREIAEFYLANNQPDVINSNCIYINEESKVIGMSIVSKQTYFFARRCVWFMNQPAVFYKTSVIRKNNYLNPKFHIAMDVDMWIKLMKMGCRFEHIPKFLGAFRWQENSKTSQVIKTQSIQSILYYPEIMVILQQSSWNISSFRAKVWRLVWQLLQVLDFNYLIRFFKTLSLAGKSLYEIPKF